jgi:hypothetical protein
VGKSHSSENFVMRSWIVTAAFGLAAVGITTLTPDTARAGGRILVGITTPGVTVTYGSGCYYPPPVVVSPPPVVVAGPPVVVTSPPVVVYRTPRYHARPRVYVRVP